MQGQQQNASFPSSFFNFSPFYSFKLFFLLSAPDTPTEYQKAAGPVIHLLRGFAIQAWSVFTKIIQVVLFALILDA